MMTILGVTAPIARWGDGDPNGMLVLGLIVGTYLAMVAVVSLMEQHKKREMAEEGHRKERERERRERERELWLRTPEGLAALEKDRQERMARLEEDKRKKEEEEKRRLALEEEQARARWREYHESKPMGEVAQMSGREFEKFLARLLSKMGYQNVRLTPINDQGGDILCVSPEGIRVVVQAKRWKGAVGNGAVQEVLGAMLEYDCAVAIIITNSRFTQQAIQLAAKDKRIKLCSGSWLQLMVKRFMPTEVPEFDRAEYEKVVRSYFAQVDAGPTVLQRVKSASGSGAIACGLRTFETSSGRRRRYKKWR